MKQATLHGEGQKGSAATPHGERSTEVQVRCIPVAWVIRQQRMRHCHPEVHAQPSLQIVFHRTNEQQRSPAQSCGMDIRKRSST
jgi:hypothetical protein